MKTCRMIMVNSYPGFRYYLTENHDDTLYSAFAANHASGNTARNNRRDARRECEQWAEDNGYSILPNELTDD